jgi:hypothetical protein
MLEKMEQVSSSSHAGKHPENLLCCCRIYDMSEDQPGKCDENGPEDFPELLVFTEQPDDSIRVRTHSFLNESEQEDEEQQEDHRRDGER